MELLTAIETSTASTAKMHIPPVKKPNMITAATIPSNPEALGQHPMTMEIEATKTAAHVPEGGFQEVFSQSKLQSTSVALVAS